MGFLISKLALVNSSWRLVFPLHFFELTRGNSKVGLIPFIFYIIVYGEDLGNWINLRDGIRFMGASVIKKLVVS